MLCTFRTAGVVSLILLLLLALSPLTTIANATADAKPNANAKIHTAHKTYGSRHSVGISQQNQTYRNKHTFIDGGSFSLMTFHKKRRINSLFPFLSKKRTTTTTSSIILIRGGTSSYLNKNKRRIDRRTTSSFSKKNFSPPPPPLPPSPPQQKDQLSSTWSRRDLAVFQSSSFFLVLSLALVTFSPAPALIARIGSERATSTLSIISACAAMTEILFSPVVGSLLDSVGRKPALLVTLSSIAIVHGAVSIHSSVLTICMAKFVSMVSVGLFFIASQVIISDISVSEPEKLSSILGVQLALIGGAFFVGAIGAGQLSNFGLSVIYGTSTMIAVVTAVLVYFGLQESLQPSKRIPFQDNRIVLQKKLLQSPWSSCTRILFRHSKEVRILAILIMVQSFPAFMGDTFQILVKTEWGLTTKDFSSFIAIFGIINIAANVVGSQLVVKLGIKYFTALATLSCLVAPISAMLFSFRGLLIGTIVGFLGSSQMLGVTAALYAEGAKSDVPQGELAGERSSFLAVAKVIGPIWYSMLYVKGKKVLGTGKLPFLFNILCGLSAFGISQSYLS
mmetsp:Transcript_11596/g.13288  ORF Transcript_11596/g.13288 Transcript_11596/m.13288 type:complete len:563 (-) Transcript_11596:161-1849(-)